MSQLTGRELDAAVAERVMGWDREEVQNALDCSHGSIAACNLVSRDLPEYSTDIAAAWLVVEEMRRRGYSIAMTCGANGDWSCLIGKRSLVIALTAPEAICRAALAALAAAGGAGG